MTENQRGSYSGISTEVEKLLPWKGAKVSERQPKECPDCGNVTKLYKVKHLLKKLCYDCRYEFIEDMTNDLEDWNGESESYLLS